MKQLWARHVVMDGGTLTDILEGLRLDVETVKKLPAHGFRFEIGLWTDENNFHISYGHHPTYFNARSHIGGVRSRGRIGHWEEWDSRYDLNSRGIITMHPDNHHHQSL